MSVIDDEMVQGYRNSDPDTSKEAFTSTNVKTVEDKIVKVVFSKGADGCTMDDIARELPQYRMHTLSPRFKPLLARGVIEDTGLCRLGGARKRQRVVRFVPEPDRHIVAANYREREVKKMEQRVHNMLKKIDSFRGTSNGA